MTNEKQEACQGMVVRVCACQHKHTWPVCHSTALTAPKGAIKSKYKSKIYLNLHELLKNFNKFQRCPVYNYFIVFTTNMKL